MNSKPPASLVFLIGRQIFDGVDAEQLAQKHGLSVDAVNQAWLECREHLSRYFADHEKIDYQLLTDNDLQARVLENLRLLLEWRDTALHLERFQAAVASTIAESPDENQPTDSDECGA